MLSKKKFKSLPLVIEGESKEIRYLGKGEVAIKLKPTVYSYTYNRTGIIEGSDKARMECIKSTLPEIKKAGINHSYLYFEGDYIISKLVLQPKTLNNGDQFMPKDLTKEEINSLPRANPVEVVVKKRHAGTPKHRYYKFNEYPTRKSTYIMPDDLYPELVVRFDWRNPMKSAEGERLADEAMPEQVANWFIDVKEARKTALKTFKVLSKQFSDKGIDLWDICFFIAEDGKTVFGEISPDCMRVRAKDGSSLDKDVWRLGGSAENVLAKWQTFSEILKSDQLV